MKQYLDKRNFYKNAFTLAEVLITVAIIGIVAALTIPAMVQNYKKRVVETRLAKFYSMINQAVQLSELDNGDKKSWDELLPCEKDEEGNIISYDKSPAEEWYNKYLKGYLKVLKVEKASDQICTIKLYFADGSLATASGASWYFYPNAKDYQSTLNEDKGVQVISKEDVGKTHFTFFWKPSNTSEAGKYHYDKGLEPYLWGWDGNINTLKNRSDIGCNVNATNEGAFCTQLIKMNGWKIPKDYPFKF